MAKTVFVFLFSNKTDPYINAMTYAFDEMEVTSVKLIHIKGALTGLTDSEAILVANSIWSRLQKLTGEDDVYKRMNERILDRHLVTLPYSSLGKELSKQVNNAGGAKNCLFDLTGATKGPSIDIFSVCLALGLKSIYAFELKQRFDADNPDAFLYHNLRQLPSSYEYNCLSDSEPVQTSQSALLRKRPLLWLVAIGAFVVLALSILLLVTGGPDSFALQLVNLSAAVTGIAASLIALFQEQQALA